MTTRPGRAAPRPRPARAGTGPRRPRTPLRVDAVRAGRLAARRGHRGGASDHRGRPNPRREPVRRHDSPARADRRGPWREGQVTRSRRPAQAGRHGRGRCRGRLRHRRWPAGVAAPIADRLGPGRCRPVGRHPTRGRQPAGRLRPRPRQGTPADRPPVRPSGAPACWSSPAVGGRPVYATEVVFPARLDLRTGRRGSTSARAAGAPTGSKPCDRLRSATRVRPAASRVPRCRSRRRR